MASSPDTRTLEWPISSISVPIIEAHWGGRALAEWDLHIDPATNRVTRTRLFPPQDLCGKVNAAGDACVNESADGAVKAQYKGRTIEPDADVIRAMEPALRQVRARQAAPLHVTVDTVIRRSPDVGAPLGNLFADAMRESVPGADVALNNNGLGGLRADLLVGPLTFGRLYDVFAFDNRLVQLTLTGAQLRTVIADEVARLRPGALAVSGMVVSSGCGPDHPKVRLTRSSGQPIGDEEQIRIVTSDMLAGGVVFASVARPADSTFPSMRRSCAKSSRDGCNGGEGTSRRRRSWTTPTRAGRSDPARTEAARDGTIGLNAVEPVAPCLPAL